VYIIIQTVRYHHFAQFSISYPTVPKCTCRWQCFPNCCIKCENRTQWIQRIKLLSTHPNWINKENSRNEIWHYSAYKTDDKVEWTDLTAPVCKCCYNSCVAKKATHQIFKHFSLAHPHLFRELRDRQVSASFINSDFILSFIYNWSTHIQMWYSKLKRACDTLEPVKFWSCNICTCISYNRIFIEFELSKSFTILILVWMISRECFLLIWSSRESEIYIWCFFLGYLSLKRIWEREN